MQTRIDGTNKRSKWSTYISYIKLWLLHQKHHQHWFNSKKKNKVRVKILYGEICIFCDGGGKGDVDVWEIEIKLNEWNSQNIVQFDAALMWYGEWRHTVLAKNTRQKCDLIQHNRLHNSLFADVDDNGDHIDYRRCCLKWWSWWWWWWWWRIESLPTLPLPGLLFWKQDCG